jgi:hypothetical protein
MAGRGELIRTLKACACANAALLQAEGAADAIGRGLVPRRCRDALEGGSSRSGAMTCFRWTMQGSQGTSQAAWSERWSRAGWPRPTRSAPRSRRPSRRSRAESSRARTGSGAVVWWDCCDRSGEGCGCGREKVPMTTVSLFDPHEVSCVSHTKCLTPSVRVYKIHA